MGGCKAPITTFIVEPFVPHDQEYYLSIVSDRLGSTISFSECGGIEIEENWDKVWPYSSFYILYCSLLPHL
jgi:ATP citrate (pro-S)-lyase